MRQVIAAVLLAWAATAGAQENDGRPPEAVLLQGLPLTFPAEVDANSPAFGADGCLHVFNSVRHPYLSEGRNVARLDDPVGVIFRGGVAGPRWMESVIQEEDGTLYGFHHHEPSGLCSGSGKTAPQNRAARSRDGGFTWGTTSGSSSPLRPARSAASPRTCTSSGVKAISEGWTTPRPGRRRSGWWRAAPGTRRSWGSSAARGRGTDTLAGQYARFFMAGRSDFLIRFDAPATPLRAARAAN